jgi:outer membrane receptor protein involved in Fe transport
MLSSAAAPLVAHAQTAPAASTPASATAPAADASQVSDVVVTGSARPQRRFDVSYAVNTLTTATIEQIAPKNYAELLGSVPGIQIEPTGGEVQNVTRVRGLPGDRTDLIAQQDGLPLFQETDGIFFNSNDGMNRFDLMTDHVEIVRGGPSPIYASTGAAIVNNITVSGGPVARGAAQLTVGDGGLYRLDALQSGPINSNTYYAVGGFIRYNSGLRNNGFPTDRGGQIRGNIKHDFDNGSIKVSAQYLDDHNVFYLPIPIDNPLNPSQSLDKYIDYFNGTMNTPALRNVNIQYTDGSGAIHSLTRDLANGRHINFGNVGVQYQGDFSGTTVSFKSSLTKGHLSFDAFYSTSNPADANTFASGQLAAAKKAFGPNVASLGYAIAGTSGATLYNPYADSGLVVQGQYRVEESDFYSVINDLSATREFNTGFGSHDVKAGVYSAFWGMTSLEVFQDYLSQVKGQPQMLDLLAYSPAGGVLGSVTNNGALHDTTLLNQAKIDSKMFAFYLNDTWSITDKLRLDAGVRREWYNYTGYNLPTASKPLPGATLASTFALGFTGAINRINVSPTATNWTVGLNYDFDPHFGVYGRVSQLQAPALSQVYLSYPLAATPTSSADQYEVGLKTVFGRNYLYLTGFYSYLNPLNASFTAFNPQTGANANVAFVGTAIEKGIEADGLVHIGEPFSVAGQVTVSSPEYQNFSSVTGASSAAIHGKQIVREPKILATVRPTYETHIGGDNTLQAYASYSYVGQRYVDVLNTTALPAYDDVGAGVILTHGNWKLQVVGDNLFDAHGLTEGNTRTDSLSGQGTPVAVYGRPVLGRNVRFIIGLKW